VEEHFYLLWPLLVFALSRRQFGWLLAVTLVAPVALRFYFVMHGIEVLYFTFTRADALGYGALLAWLLTGDTADAWRQTKLFRWLFVGLGALLVPAFVLLSGGKFLWLQAFKLSLIPMFYFALLGFCIVDPAAAWLTRIFSMGWLRWLGGISYGLYVLHQLCFLLVARWLGTAKLYVEFPLAIAAAIAAAYVSFRFFEAPILKLKRHFEYAPENPR
jgi:peptidoglycan/LPS O-acetylase OafA/YrhL